jgi:hypothetical protein
MRRPVTHCPTSKADLKAAHIKILGEPIKFRAACSGMRDLGVIDECAPMSTLFSGSSTMTILVF